MAIGEVNQGEGAGSKTRATVARLLLTLAALVTCVGAALADWNDTHIYNPRWPPHAKFHTGQTISMGVALGLSTLLFTWRRSGDARTNLLAATLFAGTYWWTQAAANFVPGTAWTDPEFLKQGQSLTQFPPQGYIDIALTCVVLLAAWLGWPRSGEREASRGQIAG